jgi:DNA repair exonuclease SbcCD nuclease subunit
MSMRILHTSDLHLRADSKATTDALKTILQTAAAKRVDLLTIGGDIFHSERDADILRPAIRPYFDDLPFRVIGIPGNHDGSIFKRGFDFGPEIVIKSPYQEIEIGNIAIVALPYTSKPDENLLLALESAGNAAKTRILLLHCTLDIGCGSNDYGEENDKSYFPVSQAVLSKLGYDFVLSGHFHNKFRRVDLPSGGIFVYPGSPISHTKRESGKRYVALIDTDSQSLRRVPLPTPYYEHATIHVIAGQERDVLSDLAKWCGKRSKDECELEVTVRGTIRRRELGFRRDLEKAAPKATIRHEYRDVGAILSHVLYKRFKRKVDSNRNFHHSEDMKQAVLEIMSYLTGEGQLRQ